MERKSRTTAPYLIVPGWEGSGPEHWQTHFERELVGATRVEMPDWSHPQRADWLATLDRAVRALATPPIVIAHSLGCIAVAHWAATSGLQLRGAFLVAPADLDRDESPLPLRGFAPLPRRRLPFPSRVIASDDDPLAALPTVTQLASDWGSSLTVLRGAGHINTVSGFGPWPAGLALLRAFELECSTPFERAEPEAEHPLIWRSID